MLEDFKKEIRLKDNTPILIRLASPDDEPSLLNFFSNIPDHEKWFLRDDIVKPEAFKSWVKRLNHEKILPLVAINMLDSNIVADIQLHKPKAECLRHIGHIRIMVHPDYRRKSLGPLMLQCLVQLAMDLGIEKLAAELVVDVQEPAIKAATRLDFREQARLRDYVKGTDGKYHDLLIMVKTIQENWDDF